MKTSRKLFKNQRGFALLHILPAFVLVAAIAFVGGSVYQAQVKKQEAARIAAEDAERKKQAELSVKQDESEAQKEVDVPAPAPEQKPAEESAPVTKPAPAPAPTKTKPSYTYVGISSVSHSVNGDAVTLTATLPGAYNGSCAAKVKLSSDYSKYQYATATFSGSTCSVTFSATTLSGMGSSGFIAFMSWNNNEYTVKGDHGGYNFNL